jgi:RNA polymerase sigma-70 factor (family 1)
MTNDALQYDQCLIARLRQDDQQAFAALYERHWKKLFSTAYNILRDEEAARDIVQDIFVSLWERRHDTTIEYPLSYLLQATKFGVFKSIRTLSRRNAFYDRLARVSTDIILENPMLFKDLSHLVNGIIRQLPEKQRQAFLYSREAGMSYSDIAREMNISVKMVEKYISRTLHVLRLKLHNFFFTIFL